MYPQTTHDFKMLEEEGKTVIYRETNDDLSADGWDFWSHKNDTKVWRKIVTFEEAEQYQLENDLLN